MSLVRIYETRAPELRDPVDVNTRAGNFQQGVEDEERWGRWSHRSPNYRRHAGFLG